MRLGLAVFLIVVSAGASGLLATATTSSGLRGRVTIGPLTPVCTAEIPCYGPAKNVTLRFTRSGYVARTVTTSDTGRYRIFLAPGTYAVRANRGRLIEPSRVVVHGGVLVGRDFSIDTGIR
jgi:hypothetical protein